MERRYPTPRTAATSAHGDLAHQPVPYPLEDLIQALTGDGEAVILQAHHRVARVGRLAHLLGHRLGHLQGPAGVVEGRRLRAVDPRVSVEDGPYLRMLPVDHPVFDRVHRDSPGRDVG